MLYVNYISIKLEVEDAYCKHFQLCTKSGFHRRDTTLMLEHGNNHR